MTHTNTNATAVSLAAILLAVDRMTLAQHERDLIGTDHGWDRDAYMRHDRARSDAYAVILENVATLARRNGNTITAILDMRDDMSMDQRA